VTLGFNPQRILLVALDPPESLYTGEKRLRMVERVLDRVRAVPGVQSATLSASALVSDDADVSTFHPSEKLKQDREEDQAYVHDIGTDYFRTMGIPILAGRAIDEHDTPAAPKVAVVNQSLARKFFGKNNPIGKTFNDDRMRIVGISADSKFDKMREAAPPTFYRAASQSEVFFTGQSILAIKTAGDPLAMIRAAREAIALEDRNLAPFAIRTQEQQIEQNIAPERTIATLATGFSLVALLLACIGIYGIMAYNVARRTGEMGIRMALGAQKSAVLGMVLRETLTVAAAGVTLGLLAAFVATRATASLLYDLKPYDPATMAGAAVVMLLFAGASGFLPARRAASIEPSAALREE
jgi:predicted permease